MDDEALQQALVQPGDVAHQLVEVIVGLVFSQIQRNVPQAAVLVEDQGLLAVLADQEAAKMDRQSGGAGAAASSQQRQNPPLRFGGRLLAGARAGCAGGPALRQSWSAATGLVRYSLQPARMASRIRLGSALAETAIRLPSAMQRLLHGSWPPRPPPARSRSKSITQTETSARCSFCNSSGSLS